MKLSFILLIVTFFQANAMTFAQKVSMKVSKAPLNTVFYELSKQTGYNFMADANLSKKIHTVSVDLQAVSLKQAIEKCFEGIAVDVVLNEEHKTVFIKEAPKAKAENREMTRKVQQHTVSGTVRSPDNQLMQGVSIGVRNKSTRAFTDEKGNYSVTVSPNDTVVYSFIGYASQLQPVKGRSNINVVLQPAEEKIDDVVVIGYGEVKRSDLTGSVGEVSMEDLQKAPVATMEQALAGRIAGVQVSSNDGQPGEGMNIVIRGGNSLTQSNAPLYVIDGFPTEDAISGVLNPKDIESITVLKDASATAIYGSRGANGVIVVETKKGKVGAPSLTYDASLGYQNVTKQMEMMSPYEFVKYQLEINPSIATTAYLTRPERILDDYRHIDPIDWQGKMFETAPLHIHNLSLTGGTGQTKYAVSGSIFDQSGIIVNSGHKRYQGRVLLDQRINEKLRLFVNVNSSKENSYGQPVRSHQSNSLQAYSTYLMYRVWGYTPVELEGMDIDQDPIDDMATDDRFNPYLSAMNEINKRTTNTLFANARLHYAFAKDFELTIRGGISNRSILQEAFYNELTSRGYPFANNTRGVNGQIYNTHHNRWVNENLLRYRKRINRDNNINVIAGMTFQSNENKHSGFASQRVPNPELGISGLDQGELMTLASSISKNTLVSFLSRANYNFKSKYLFTASFRADASSKFAKGQKWGYFPSGAFAWSMGKEGFMKTLDFVSDAKLRVSYGITGNNRVTDFPYLSPLNMPFGYFYSFNNQTPMHGVVSDGFGNEDLRWESTEQVDIGYDLSLFKDRINLTVDLYRKNTKDLLLDAVVPYSTGYSTIFKNIGRIRNEGIEVSLSTVNYRNKSFEWSSDFNIAFNRNKVLALSEGQEKLISTISFPASYTEAQLYLAKVGGPASSFFGYKWEGNYQIEDFDVLSDGSYRLKKTVPSNGSPNVQPGDIKYRDYNGDGVVNDQDRVFIGRGIPIHVGGFNNNFVYKNLSLNVFFQWSYGNDIYNANRDMFEGNEYNRAGLNQYATYANRWTPENPNNEYFRSGGQGPTGMFSSRVIEDGSFLRLKTVALSYRLPESISKRLTLKNIEAYMSAQNIFTWTKYSGMDPEVSVQNSALTPGLDYSAYPRERAITFGVKVSL